MQQGLALTDYDGLIWGVDVVPADLTAASNGVTDIEVIRVGTTVSVNFRFRRIRVWLNEDDTIRSVIIG